ncbi:hypothetical protein SDJN02_13985, partial [Cucurbita argyrosperma subsp. argyrosperma]
MVSKVRIPPRPQPARKGRTGEIKVRHPIQMKKATHENHGTAVLVPLSLPFFDAGVTHGTATTPTPAQGNGDTIPAIHVQDSIPNSIEDSRFSNICSNLEIRGSGFFVGLENVYNALLIALEIASYI